MGETGSFWGNPETKKKEIKILEKKGEPCNIKGVNTAPIGEKIKTHQLGAKKKKGQKKRWPISEKPGGVGKKGKPLILFENCHGTGGGRLKGDFVEGCWGQRKGVRFTTNERRKTEKKLGEWIACDQKAGVIEIAEGPGLGDWPA